MSAVAGAACAVVGLAAGPGLARLADRVPERKPLAGGGWRSPDAVAISVVAGAVFAGIGVRLAGSWALPAFLVFAGCVIVVTFTDLRLYLIPNRIVYPTLFASAVLLPVAAAIDGDWGGLRSALFGSIGAWLAMLILHLINPKGMAFGDVRLAAVIGAYAGWFDYSHVVLSLVLAFMTAAVAGLVLVVTRTRSTKDPVPFAPFLAVGALAAVVFGNAILDWWQG